VAGEYAYLFDLDANIDVVTLRSPPNPERVDRLLSFGTTGLQVGNYTYMASGEALSTLTIYETGTSSLPRHRATYRLPALFHDIQVRGDLIYIADGEGGLQILQIHPERFLPDLYLPLVGR
jgi:hypothetical protein